MKKKENPKNSAPIWAAIALALGFTSGNVAGSLSTGEKVEAAPIYDLPVSWAVGFVNDQAQLRVRAYSSLNFPVYPGQMDLELSTVLKNEILSLKPGASLNGALVTNTRAVVRVGDEFIEGDHSAPLVRQYIEKNLSTWCATVPGLCEPAPVKGKKLKEKKP